MGPKLASVHSGACGAHAIGELCGFWMIGLSAADKGAV